MRLGAYILLLGCALIFTGCGKNDPFVPGGANAGGPYTGLPNGGAFAPAPPYGGYPNAGYGNGVPYPYGYASNPFQYQNIPTGFNPNMLAWLPLQQWMQQEYYRSLYYQQLIQYWHTYAYYYGYNVYDFSVFWLQFCPQVWSGTPYMAIYDFYSSNVYHPQWFGWQTQFPTQGTQFYWQSYGGLPFDALDQLFLQF